MYHKVGVVHSQYLLSFQTKTLVLKLFANFFLLLELLVFAQYHNLSALCGTMNEKAVFMNEKLCHMKANPLY